MAAGGKEAEERAGRPRFPLIRAERAERAYSPYATVRKSKFSDKTNRTDGAVAGEVGSYASLLASDSTLLASEPTLLKGQKTEQSVSLQSFISSV